MKNRYDGSPSKDVNMRATRHNRHEMEARSNDDFAKRVNAEQARMAGRPPRLEAKDMDFNAEMMNTGEHAQELARDITKGLDKTAFPVK